jgi:hypothetical protein
VPRLRRGGLPREAAAAVEPGERVIAWATIAGGDPTMVTLDALYLPAATGGYERLPFERIAAAGWDDPVLEITMTGQAHRRHVVRLEEPGELPPAVRERVMASIVVSERVDLGGGAGALVTARRARGRDGLSWNVVFDPGLDPTDPVLQARANAAIAAIRASTGV